jgi:hypothetical protein
MVQFSLSPVAKTLCLKTLHAAQFRVENKT